MSIRKGILGLCLLASLACTDVTAAGMQSTSESPTLITRPIQNGERAHLLGSTNPLAASSHDRGRMQRDQHLNKMILQLKRTPDQRQELDLLIAQQQNPRSPDRRHWLTASQVGDLYGPSQADVTKVAQWMTSRGFRIGRIAKSRTSITFSGNVDAIESTFGAQVHTFTAGSTTFPGIVGEASIPAALQDVVGGVVLAIPLSQSNFGGMATGVTVKRSAAPGNILPQMTLPDGTGGNYLIVTPQDFATIYNVRPTWAQGITGAGQTIAIPAASNVRADDWLKFRTSFGLPVVPLNIIHPGCADPGLDANGIGEASVDVQWAAAAAPDADVQLASCPDSTYSSGAITALENLIDSSTPPPIISWSYGSCERTLDQATRDYIQDLLQQAAAQGTSVFVSAGDAGPGFCEPYAQWIANGIDVNAWAATPYAVAVGATDFSDAYSGTTSQYWDLSHRSTSAELYKSALSYIPEMTWNSSCASQAVYAKYGIGFSSMQSFCNSGFNAGRAIGGGGGASFYTQKPAWQAGVLGNPNDQKRGIPDVALFGATPDWWQHALVYCATDPSMLGTACDYDGPSIFAAGGSSFSTPAFAGIQALINQKLESRQGNPNYAYYQIARLEYNSGVAGFGSVSTCNASNGTLSGTDCVFHDIVLGDTTQPCYLTSANCFAGGSVGQYGLLSSSSTSAVPTWPATPGWDFATGLGSVDVTNLVNAIATVDSYVSSISVAGDLNGDHYADILLTNPGVGNMGRWLMRGNTIQHSLFHTTPAGYTARGFGDVNGDGSADVLWANSAGDIAVWFAEGESGFVKSPLGAGPSGSVFFGSADFNGDGFDDLVFQNNATNLVTIWLMTGSTTLQTITRPLAPGARVVAVGDFDHDGLADLGIQNATGAVSILRTLPDTTYSMMSVGQAPSGSQALGASDLNGDGYSDLVFFNATTGVVTSWLLNGASITAAPTLSLYQGYFVASIADVYGTGSSALVVTSTDHDLLLYGLNTSNVWVTDTIGDGQRQLFGSNWSIVPVQAKL